MPVRCRLIASGWSMADLRCWWMLSPENEDQINTRTGAINEQGTIVAWHKKGRVHSDIRWQARKVEGQRTPFCRVGNLSCERFAGGSESTLCFANQRLVWTNHSALE